MCAMLDPHHRSEYPGLIGLDVSTGWMNEVEALDFAQSHLWQLSSRQETIERLFREFESAWCHFRQSSPRKRVFRCPKIQKET